MQMLFCTTQCSPLIVTQRMSCHVLISARRPLLLSLPVFSLSPPHLLSLAASSPSSPSRSPAARLISSLLQHPVHSSRLSLSLSRLLPAAFLSFARDDSTGSSLLSALSRPSHTPELVWNAAAATFLARRVASLADSLANSLQALLGAGGTEGGVPAGQLADEVFGGLGDFVWDPPGISAELAAAAVGRVVSGGSGFAAPSSEGETEVQGREGVSESQGLKSTSH